MLLLFLFCNFFTLPYVRVNDRAERMQHCSQDPVETESQLRAGRMDTEAGAPGVLVRITLESVNYLPLSRHSNVTVFPICEFPVWPHL